MAGMAFEFFLYETKKATCGTGTFYVGKLPRHNEIPKPKHVIPKRHFWHPSQFTCPLDYICSEMGLHFLIGVACTQIMRVLLAQVGLIGSPFCFRRNKHCFLRMTNDRAEKGCSTP